MTQGQLGDSSQAPFFSGLEHDIRLDFGLLGNHAIQLPAPTEVLKVFWTAYSYSQTVSGRFSKLSSLKHRTFTAEGRQRRIAASLQAINSPQPTTLSLAQWKEIVEEIEDED